MVFSSYLFLCIFLPVVFVLHTLIKDMRIRNALLVVASVLFYACGEPIYCVLLLFSVVLNFLFGRMVNGPGKKFFLVIAIIFNISMLFVFKYAGFAMTELNKLLFGWVELPVPKIPLPIGISFYTFQAMSYVIDVYRGETAPQKNFLRLLLYISFFPQLIAGPIVKYHDIEKQLDNRVLDSEGIKAGILRFTAGLGKKILIANVMAKVADALYGLDVSNIGFVSAWMASISYCIQIYFDFSGYSDMALGLGKMFGFTFPENFNYPYIAGSVREFWRRWHISLSSWFRDYLYIPLGGNRKGEVRTILNNYAVFFTTGIWHGAAWTFLGFGIWHGNFMMLERIKGFPLGKGKLKPLDHIYVLLVANIGFIFMRADTLKQAFYMIKGLFGFGTRDFTTFATAVSFLTPYYIFIFVIAVIASTGIIHKLYLKVAGKLPGTVDIASMFGSVAVLLLCYMQLAADSYNPFIYFKF